VWDLKSPATPLVTHVIDQSSSQPLPFFDEPTQLLFVPSKGEATIRYYELTTEPPFCHFISNFGEGVPARGVAQFPKVCFSSYAL
jgi:hypothetical protein